MTFEEWIDSQSKDFWRLPLDKKFAAIWQAARREARWDFERSQEYRYQPTTPRNEVQTD